MTNIKNNDDDYIYYFLIYFNSNTIRLFFSINIHKLFNMNVELPNKREWKTTIKKLAMFLNRKCIKINFMLKQKNA